MGTAAIQTRRRTLSGIGRWGCGIALLLLLVVLALAPGAAPVAASTVTVHMVNNTYQQSNLTVRVGTTVKWINDDQAEIHDIVNPDGVFGTGDLYHGGTYQWMFTQTGVYDYYCSHHGGMVGTITVTDAQPTPTATNTPMPAPTRHANVVPTIAATDVPKPATHFAAPTSTSVSVATPHAQPARH